jgi:hypothetical protein
MPCNLRSTVLFSSAIAASVPPSPRAFGPVAAVPSPAPRPAPVVTPDRELAADPEDCAVPALLVPVDGGVASLDELPAPLGSFPELVRPAALPGPDGTPLVPDDPAPAVPAFGVPTALGLPAEGPLAAPPAAAPPPLAPPPPAPPEPPPPCARAREAPARSATATAMESDSLVIGRSPFVLSTAVTTARSGTISSRGQLMNRTSRTGWREPSEGCDSERGCRQP